MLFEIENTLVSHKNQDNKLCELDNGFFKGNMFEKLYEGYKNYYPCRIEPKSQEMKDLLEIMMLDFAINDLNLYLDIHEDDHEMYEVFKQYAMMYKKKLMDYERKYQVLCLTDDILGKYTWTSSPWPWEEYDV